MFAPVSITIGISFLFSCAYICSVLGLFEIFSTLFSFGTLVDSKGNSSSALQFNLSLSFLN